MKISVIFLLLIFYVIDDCAAQRNNIWCFGDSAGIDFNNASNPLAIGSSIVSRGSCVSIADTAGSLLFYANTDADEAGTVSGIAWNKNNDQMLGGDSIAGSGWYQEMVIVPNPADDSSYYLFSIGVTTPYGLKYSIIDMRGDNGLGEVTQKNIQLLNFYMVDCLLAVKHGNGRDWWIITRKSPWPQPFIDNNSWYLFLISPSGISPWPVQNIGTLNGTNSGRLCFNSIMNQIAFVNAAGIIELYDFDRCIGIVSNANNVELLSLPYPTYWSCEFSNSGQYLYVTSSTNPISKLWQFDTWAPNIAASKTLIWQTSFPPYTGALKRAPDNKIYLSSSWVDSSGATYFPYIDTMYYPENMNLSVINLPDSAGGACDFQPWSFYLGGKRTYWGLPNNPDYDLGPLIGSSCDTIVGINEFQQPFHNPSFYIYYNSTWESAFLNVDKIKGTTYQLQIHDALGKKVFSENGKIVTNHYHKNLNCAEFSKGVYIAILRTEKDNLSKKFVVE